MSIKSEQAEIEGPGGAAPARPRGRPRSTTRVVADDEFQLPDLVPMELTKALARAIVLGEYEPGSRFVEEDIAAAFKVSRSPVREAFRRLESDGLVIREARRGVRVTPISIQDLDEVYSCRLELEGLAAERAAVRGPEARDWLEAGYRALEVARRSEDMIDYFDANVALTERIHELTGNNTLIRLLAGLTKQAHRYRFFAYRRVPEMLDYSLQANRVLVDAIAAGDGRASREQARDLVRQAWTKIRQALS